MIKVLTALMLLLGNAAIHAMPVYTYSTDNFSAAVKNTTPAGGVKKKGGDIRALETTFNTATGDFTWTYTAKPGKNGKDNDGFRLVVSDGPGPKYQTGEFAILYGDVKNNRVTAYEYDGDNDRKSFENTGGLLDIFLDSITSEKMVTRLKCLLLLT